jgi:hypothetical protein
MNANKENAEGLGRTSAKRKRKLSTPERELSVTWKKVTVRVCNEGTSLTALTNLQRMEQAPTSKFVV